MHEHCFCVGRDVGQAETQVRRTTLFRQNDGMLRSANGTNEKCTKPFLPPFSRMHHTLSFPCVFLSLHQTHTHTHRYTVHAERKLLQSSVSPLGPQCVDHARSLYERDGELHTKSRPGRREDSANVFFTHHCTGAMHFLSFLFSVCTNQRGRTEGDQMATAVQSETIQKTKKKYENTTGHAFYTGLYNTRAQRN